MIETIQKEWQAKVALVIFILLTCWWVYGILNPQIYATRFFGDFPSIYAIMALWGGTCGLFIAQKWGGFRSVLGKAIIMFSLGLYAQVFGQLAYAYLAFYKNIPVPYPSIGDIGYFGSIPFYIYGIILLATASGVQIRLKSFSHKLQAIIIPLIMLAVGYFLFLQGYVFDWSNPLKIFLDFGYPFAQAIYVSLALLTYLLSRGILGGLMKGKILFILFALIIQFLCDYTFLYQSSRSVWAAGGVNDYMYLISYFVMTIGLLQFDTVLSKIRQHEG